MVKAYSSDALSLSFTGINERVGLMGVGELDVYEELGFPPLPPPREEEMNMNFGAFRGAGRSNRGGREIF